MKVVILAGGYGSRLGNLSELIPKPMIEIGGRPIIWHIMKTYSHFGFNEFVLCLGYKGNVIKEYFLNSHYYNNDFTIDVKENSIKCHMKSTLDPFTVTLVDTGLNNLKGSRIKQIEKYLDDEINFLTYGDGVANVDITQLLAFHKSHGKMVTITGVKPPSMFGEMIEEDGLVLSFEEKPQTSKGLINGGYMVFNKGMLDFLSPDPNCDFEFGPLEQLVKAGQVMTYRHDGFWECADTVRDLEHLNKLWKENRAVWKLWQD